MNFKNVTYMGVIIMLRKDLYFETKKVIEIFEKLDMRKHTVNLLESKRRKIEKNIDLSQVLDVLNKYSIEYNNFSDKMKYIVSCMGLGDLHNPTFWSTLIFTEDISMISKLNVSLRFLSDNLPKILLLLENEAIKLSNNENINPEFDVITLVLPEEKDMFSSAKRVTEAISAVIDLYEVCIAIEQMEESELSLISADSGSDKSFDLLGATKVVECVKDLILKIWDKVVYHRNDRVNANVESLLKALPAYEKIKELEETKAMSPEKAELLRRSLTKSINGILMSGIVIPEMEDNCTFSPQKLMAPEPKLLISPQLDNKNFLNDDENINNYEDCNEEIALTEEEVALVEKMKKMGKI
jgi:hypothetical protein